MLDILARVATRPNPKVSLGPVDMTASFVVVDTTKPDHPIVHVSPGFTNLTGYTESEILGRNCRFLQAPPDKFVEKGSRREFTDQNAVAKLAQYLSQNNECQVSLLNYRKSGEPFLNCLTVIPLCIGPGSEARYHVGFQVDLATQPRAIMDCVKNGTYIVNYPATHAPTGSGLNSRLITQDMMSVLGTIYPEKAGKQYDELRDREDLSKALVRFATGAFLSPYLPVVFPSSFFYTDPILVLSLKGHFLYVSPSVSRLFGYDEDWFMGKNLTDLCHPADQVATMRALKETSPTSGRPTLSNDNEPPDERPGTVHLLFRASINTNIRSGGNSRADAGGKDKDKDAQEYIWVECPSRLHTDGARGRKAVIVHVRRREVPRVSWSSINASDGIVRDDVWIRIARDARALVLDASENALRVLGRASDDLVGASLMDLLVDDARGARRDALRAAIACPLGACRR
jgi:PAS domain-containing protein